MPLTFNWHHLNEIIIIIIYTLGRYIPEGCEKKIGLN